MILEQFDNYGSLMALYQNSTSQFRNSVGGRHRKYGFQVDENKIPSFQQFLPSSFTSVQVDIYNIVDDTLVGTIPNSLVQKYRTSDSSDYWVRYNIDDTSGLRLCGYYEARIYLNGGSTPFYSEVFHAAPRSGNKDWYKLRLSSSYDIDRLLMQGNYAEEVYFEASLVFPEMEITQESFLDGANEIQITNRSSKLRAVMELYNVPDYMVLGLSKLTEQEDVTIEKCETGELFSLDEIEFSTIAQDTGFQTGVLKFTRDNVVFDGCGTQKSIVELLI